MKIITFEDIRRQNIAPTLCYQWAVDMIAHKHDAILPPKISLKPADGVFCNVMPCMIPNETMGSAGGVKVVTRYPGRTPSLEADLLLMDAETGEFLALMDATWITAMRTGAVAAHSILLLAKKDFHTLGILGLGNTARAALLTLLEVMPPRPLHIKLLRYKGQEVSFAQRFAAYEQVEFSYVDTNEELVKGSDVVISGATYLPQDLCGDDCFDEGVLVVPIHTLDFTNCDLFFDKVFADDYGHVCHFKNFDKFRSFAEVSDVLSGKAPGRENDRERILAYNIGVSIHDINFAARIYELLKDDPALRQVDLCQPAEKFWIRAKGKKNMNGNLTRAQFEILAALEKAKRKHQEPALEQMDREAWTSLEELGYVSGGEITVNGIYALEPYRVRRAVFIAAGFGSRMVPVTLNTPKPLVRVNGTRIIDTLLDAVIAADIPEIIIVRGYLAEQFDQLLYKYPMLKFIENPAYNEANNISSAMCARYLLGNAYVFEADLLLSNPDIICKYHYCSNFLGIPVKRSDDWCFDVENGIIKGQKVGGIDCYQEVGISFWSEMDGAKLSDHIKRTYEMPGGKERYWDQVPFAVFPEAYQVELRECRFEDIVEIDTYRELKAIDKTYDI